MPKKAHPLATLFFTIFLDMLGVGILIPVIPTLFADPHSTHYVLPPGTSQETAYILLGALTALYSIGQFFASSVIGQFSDKLGRKKLLAFSIFGGSIGYALFGVGVMIKSAPLLFFSRFLSGVTGGNIVVAQASIADLTTPENRAKNFGLIGAAFGLGFILGPFIGGKLADSSVVSWFDPSVPFWFAALLALSNVFSVLLFLQETNIHADRTKVVDWGKSWKNILHAWHLKDLRPLFITNFFFQFGFTFYVSFSAIFLITRFGFSESSIGNYFAYVGLWIVFTQAVLTRLVAPKWSEEKILRKSIFAVAATIGAILLVYQVTWLYFVVPFFAMAVGLSQANMTGLLSRRARPEVQGQVLGINGSVSALAMAIPPILSGFFAAVFSPEAPLVLAMLSIGFSGIYFIVTRKQHTKMYQEGSGI